MDALRGARLRSNPTFRLVPFDQLSSREQRIFQSLCEEPHFYGLLVPPAGSMAPIKSVSRDAALLFLTLREPASLPRLVDSLFQSAEDQLRQLILDGIFEVEHSGCFVSGPSAAPLLGAPALPETPSHVAQLSRSAIEYALALEGLSLSELAARLYLFNRAPGTRRAEDQFGNDKAVLEFLAGDGAVARQLELGWLRENSGDTWFMWRAPGSAPNFDFKLYVSPTIESLPEAFKVTVEALVRVKCSHFKIAKTAFGLLRPDKLIAYFACLEKLQEAAELIRASACSLFAQGVPFTAAIDLLGLVSWGMDPPRLDQVLPRQRHQSWRQWVAERVAVYSIAAKESAATSPVEFVLDRVALDGIDQTTWAPSLDIWRRRGGTITEEIM